MDLAKDAFSIFRMQRQNKQIPTSLIGLPMKTHVWRLAACFLLSLSWPVQAVPNNPNTDWFKDAKYGVFMHFLPGDAKGLALVNEFDVQGLSRQLETLGAKYFVITLGQNSGFFNAPNAAYDRYTGYAPGERCSTRDLPLDLYRALQPKGIRLMLYLPCQTPNQDARAQKAFGLAEGKKDQPIDLEFARKWAQVIQEWSDRYGDKVAGWWFDGGYQSVRFNEAIARDLRRGSQARQSERHRDLQSRRPADPPHAGRGLHGGRAERSLQRAARLALGGRLAVARPDLSSVRSGLVGIRGTPRRNGSNGSVP